MVCELKGITVCRQHYKIIDGVVVSSIAQKGLWKSKAKKIAKKKSELLHGNQLSERR